MKDNIKDPSFWALIGLVNIILYLFTTIRQSMELSMRELNELIYCIEIARKYGELLGTTTADKLEVRLLDELNKRLEPNYNTIK